MVVAARAGSKQDPRIERTIKLLGDALRELILEKGYDVLTVQDITDRANVSRTTFYLHFKDKDELLFSTMRQVYSDLMAGFERRAASAQTLEELETLACDASDYEHVAENADFYRTMLGKHGSAAFIQDILNYITDEMRVHMLEPAFAGVEDLPIPIEVVSAFTAGAEIGMMSWWLNNKLKYTPEQMARFQYTLTVGGLTAILGMMEKMSDPGS